MRKLLLILFSATFCYANAQTYPVSDIANEMRTNANAVVRYDETIFTQNDINTGLAKYTYAVTILNEKGLEHAEIIIYQDIFRELKSFSGIVLDSISGKVIKKISKSDLYTSAYSSHIASDDKYSVYSYTPSHYPFTIKYEYEVKYKNGIFSYPAFMPVTGFGLSVEKATYSMHIPKEFKIHYKSMKMPGDGKPDITEKNSAVDYTWNVKDIQAIKHELFAPGISKLTPNLLITPE